MSEESSKNLGKRKRDSLSRSDFGKAPSGESVSLYTISNNNGISVSISNLGAIITSIITPDRSGNAGDIVQGFSSAEGYAEPGGNYHGAVCGRYANRIANGKFKLNGKEYTLAQNNGENHLHGGTHGFNEKVYEVEEVETKEHVGLSLTAKSDHMEEGYPGELKIKVVYTLNEKDELRVAYSATTSEDTVINLTNHAYFNLTGKELALDHVLHINADRYTPVDNTLIPTGELAPVKGTAMDFTTPTRIGDRIDSDFEQLKIAGGYDHNWVINNQGSCLELAVKVYDPSSGREMAVLTDQPGVQFYTGNFLTGSLTGKDGTKYEKRSAVCFETQRFPDSPNRPDFPTTTLKADEEYKTSTVFQFSVRGMDS